MGRKISEDKIEQALELFIKEDKKINANAVARYLGCHRSNLANNYPIQLARIDIAADEQKKRWEDKNTRIRNKELSGENRKQKKIIAALKLSSVTNSQDDEISALLEHINVLYRMYDDLYIRYEKISSLLSEYKKNSTHNSD